MKGTSHPENFCQQCGSKNPTWSAPDEVWNRFCEQWEIICPDCFQKRAEEDGLYVHIYADIRVKF